MISIHTNLSSLAVQNNLAQSTKGINTAIERMSTGYKINHAGDNAANYSISQNMNAQLSACDIAADNISMGMDLLSVAQDTIAGMQDRGSRIHALITQARNGTYGADSLNALSQEAQALVSEINRLYVNTEYNGIKLFEVPLPEWAQEVKANAGVDAGTINGKSLEQCAAEHNGFIAEVVEETPDVIVTDPTQLASAISSNTKIGIGNAQTLAKLAELVNSGTSCSGKTIILTDDIDLSAYHEDGGWNPIGNSSKRFQGTFNGNGHKVTGLYINKPSIGSQGLFGVSDGIIKNVFVSGNVTGSNDSAILAGIAQDIDNCHVSGSVKGNQQVGGIAGNAHGSVSNSYSNANITSTNKQSGSLLGTADCIVENCYATGNVYSTANTTGGLVGDAFHEIRNCYATGDVVSQGGYIGGLVGDAFVSIVNSYATGNVKGVDSVGGLAGISEAITNCYATGNVSGNQWVGGLAGCNLNTVDKSYAIGNVIGHGAVGGLAGANAANIENSYALGNVEGFDCVGGFLGLAYNDVENCYSKGNVKCTGVGEGIDYDDFLVIEDNSIVTVANGQSLKTSPISLQVGINSGTSSQISVNTDLNIKLLINDLTSDSAYNSITSFLNQLSQKATELGAAQNRLESALESNLVQMDNLTSSLSTIRDADISEVSSDFIRQQILQQAAATLLSTANQSPAIALQLI